MVRHVSRVVLLVLLLVISSCSSNAEQEGAASAPESTNTTEQLGGGIDDCSVSRRSSRTDIVSSGNRISSGSLDLDALTPVDVMLPSEPVWVVPYGNSRSWYVALASGDAVVVDTEGIIGPAQSVAGPPEIFFDEAGQVEVKSVFAQQILFDNPLPDTAVVQEGPLLAALVDPTDRYNHDVLGDELEAGAVQVIDTCSGEKTKIEVEASDVVEGVSPMLADVDNDGNIDVLVTVSNASVGAKLVAYRLDGSVLAESEPMGQGNRWRNQLAVAPVGPEGELEIIDVRVPHIGGVVEFFRFDDSSLALEASTQEYTSHVIGTRNLDMALVVDVAGGDELEVVVLTQDRQQLVALRRTDEGAKVAAEVEADGTIITNIAMQNISDEAAIAVGTDKNILRIWQ